MYTLSFILLAFQLVYCCVLVVLLLYILINSKRMELFQHNYNELNTGTGTIASQVKTTKDEHGSSWKITYHFDTTQTPDPTTGLPPLSGIEIEGSEKQSKTAQESNDNCTLFEQLFKERGIRSNHTKRIRDRDQER